MKILNLYAGIGGNRRLWGDEHEITAVEYKPEIAAIYRDVFPIDNGVVADAHQYLLEHFHEFDFIWSSPPCPTHSRIRKVFAKQNAPMFPDLSLYQEILLLRGYFKGKWCVENVIAWYAPLIRPSEVGSHWMWTNFPLPGFEIENRGRTGNKNTGWSAEASTKEMQKRTGFDLSRYNGVDKRLLLRNCVEPGLGKHILDWAMKPWEPNLKLAI